MSLGNAGFGAEEVADVARNHKTAALMEIPGTLDGSRELVSKISHALRDGGGCGVRVEGSGLASSWDPWFEALASDGIDELVSAAVLYSFDGRRYFSSGMHYFDLPDVELSEIEPEQAAAWLHAFCTFCVGERPVLATGHTFAPLPGSERHCLERWPDSRHSADDGRHNPYGLWRALGPSEEWLKPVEQAYVFVPSLTELLMGAEGQRGGALNRDEVESILEHAAVIAMDHADARAMEVARGFADLEPERVWDQWQLVRLA